MSKWANIEEKTNSFRLLCSHDDCSLSICNLLNGRLHVTTLHGNNRHSLTFDNRDMLFIVSQFIKSLKKEDRKKLLEFYDNF